MGSQNKIMLSLSLMKMNQENSLFHQEICFEYDFPIMVCKFFQSKHFFMVMFMTTMWHTSCEPSTLGNLGEHQEGPPYHRATLILQKFTVFFFCQNVHTV